MKSNFVSSLSVAVLLLLPAAGLTVPVHPIWGPVRELMAVPTGPAVHPVARPYHQPPPEIANFSMMQGRVCARVERRFAGDRTVMERVNERLRERFGFTCIVASSFVGRGRDEAVLTVSLDAFGYVGDAVPKGAMRVAVLRLGLSANCDRDIAVESIMLTDHGHGLASDVVSVWASRDGLRVTGSRRLQTSKIATLRFFPPLIVPACEAVAIDVFAAFAESALETGRHAFLVGRAGDVSADARVEGAFPLTGETFKISAQETGEVRVTYLPVMKGVNIAGSERQVIGGFAVEVDMTEDQVLHALTLENAGEAQDGEFVAIFARAAAGRARFTEVVGETYGNRVTLPFDPPHIVRKGGRVDFEIVADVVDGTGRTIQMRFEDPSDLFSVGSLYGYGDNGQLYGARVTVEGEPDMVRIR